MRAKLLSSEEIEALLMLLPGWELKAGCLYKVFKFKSFSQSFAFMTEVAFAAEKLNHHPDWQNSYNKVFVSLHTHDLKGISELDVELAKQIESIFKHEF